MGRTLEELVNVDEPAWPMVREWIAAAKNPVEVLPAGDQCADELQAAQVTVRSPMGAVIYHTGGLLIDGGWLRVLGSGHPRHPRGLMTWNQAMAAKHGVGFPGYLLIADDVVGGFFAVNGGAFEGDRGAVMYFAPDTLRWEEFQPNYSNFLNALFQADLEKFYGGLRWHEWRDDVANLKGDQAMSLYPPPWTKEGKQIEDVARQPAPIDEVYGLNVVHYPGQLGV